MTAVDERDPALVGFESLFAMTPIGIAFLDRELRYRRVNAALARMTGLPVEAHVGRSINEVLPAVAPALVPLLREVLARREPLVDIELADRDRTFAASYFPVCPGGDLIGIGGMVVETTRRPHVEAELRRAVRTREDVLAIVSHDLRAPLATIDLTATMLDALVGADPHVREHLAVIHRSADRMRHLIDDLIDSASISEGRLALQMQREPAASLLEEAVALQEAIATARGIRIERSHELDGAIVTCDRLRILQVFGNLLGNSIKFCRVGGRIVVLGRRRDREVEFAVRDDGPGISPESMPSLFDPYRAPPLQPRAGSGLGLHITKGIVERHGGRVWVDSVVGHGTTMYFTLPLA